MLLLQVTSILLLTFLHAKAEAPPGYVKPAEPVDKNPPKYEYGYNIEDEKGTSQGKLEVRDGIYALGRYYVQNGDSTQNVQYYADDWGYHPFIEYGSIGPHSKSRTQLLLGVEAVKALASNKFTPQSVPPKQHVIETINSKAATRAGRIDVASQVPQQQLHIVDEQPQQPQVVIEQPQTIVVQQPQVVVEQQQQQIAVQQPQQSQVIIEHQQPQQIVVEQQQPVLVQQQQQQVVTEQQQPQQIIIEQQPQQQLILEQQHVQQPQQVIVQQPQQPQQQQQPQEFPIQPPQQVGGGVFDQSQQIAADDSDSVVVEASGRRGQQQTQTEQVLFSEEISNAGAEARQQLAQPQLEQLQIAQEISHQVAQEQQPQRLALQSNLIQVSGKQIQDNLIIGQQSAQLETESLLSNARSSNQQILQQSQANLGGFGSRINLLGRRKPSINLQIQSNSDRLIETTRNLVSGQDVLNINGAFDQKLETTVETSTARSATPVSFQPTGQTLIRTVTEASLLNQPIVVADFDEKIVSSTEHAFNQGAQTREQIFSTTASTVETLSTRSFGVTEPSPLLVTPRPVSTNFLAPISAGIQLQNAENSQNIATKININENQKSSKESYEVEVQKSLPFYLGKFEYEQNPAALSEQAALRQKAVENIELGKTLLAFPEPQQRGNPQLRQQLPKELQRQQLPEVSIKENFVESDQQQAQGIQHQVAVQQVSTISPIVVEKVIEKEIPVPLLETRIVEKPVELTKVIKEPYPVGVPVHVPVQVPVPVEKQVPIPVPVERIVEKPVKVTEIVEKRVHVPQPYPVERIVEKQVHVPVEVTKYVDRPYPVQVPVAQPVPYPVDRVVEKIVKQPYPVPVKVPYEVKVPVTVEKIVEKKVPVPQYIEKQVPVDRIVEKPVPHYIDRPFPVHVEVPVPVAQVYALPLQTKPIQAVPQLVQPSQKFSVSVKGANNYQQGLQIQQNAFIQSSTRNNQHIPPPPQNNGYLPPHNCDQHNSFSTKNVYYTIQPDDYIGLSPPRFRGNDPTLPRRFRNARSNFNSNPKLEYGFMPPLRPSQEIDEHGNPITREKP